MGYLFVAILAVGLMEVAALRAFLGERPAKAAPARALPACNHPGKPAPVITDLGDGRGPVTVAWLCTGCTEEVPERRALPTGPGPGGIAPESRRARRRREQQEATERPQCAHRGRGVCTDPHCPADHHVVS